MRRPHLYDFRRGKFVKIDSDQFIVGRSLHCNYIINNTYISREQFRLEKVDNIWMLKDTSSNGTLLNRKLIKGEVVEIKKGDMITFTNGCTDLQFRIFEDDSDSDCILIEDPASENNSLKKRPHSPKDVLPAPESPKRKKPSPQENEVPAAGSSVNVLPENQTDEASGSAALPNVPPNNEESETTGKKDNEEAPIKNEQPEKEKVSETVEESKQKKSVSANSPGTEEFSCAICSEYFIQAMTLNCSHTFCRYCIKHWNKKRHDCPICRKRITGMARTLVLDNYIEKLVERMDENEREQRSETIQERHILARIDRKEKKKESNNKAGPSSGSADVGSVVLPLPISDDDFDDGDGYDYDEDDYNFDDDYDSDDSDEGPSGSYIGLPGSYYGGYGRCYKCHQRGHWANGCPFV